MKTPPLPFAAKIKKTNIIVTLIREKDFEKWLKAASDDIRSLARQTGFSAIGAVLITPDHRVFTCVDDQSKIYSIAPTVEAVRKYFSSEFLKSATFTPVSYTHLTLPTICSV